MGDRERIQQAQQKIEYEKLTELWKHFITATQAEVDADTSPHLCAPPAYSQFYQDRVTEMRSIAEAHTSTPEEGLRVLLLLTDRFIASIFDFAQLCSKMGIMYNELTPSTEFNVTDEEIRELLG